MSTCALIRRTECHSEFQTLWETMDEDLILLKRVVNILAFASRYTWGSQSVWVLYRIAVPV